MDCFGTEEQIRGYWNNYYLSYLHQFEQEFGEEEESVKENSKKQMDTDRTAKAREGKKEGAVYGAEIRALQVLQVLKECTDKDHTLTQKEFMDILFEEK